MTEYVIESDWAGKNIKSYLYSFLHMSRAQVTALKKREKGILVNRERRPVTYVLAQGDILSLALEDEEGNEKLVPYDLPLEILYEDEYILCVNKPAGIPTHPSVRHFDDTLANALAAYYMKKGIPFVFRAANRLDRDTGGVVLVGKNKYVSAALSAQVVKRTVDKRYVAVLEGEIEDDSGTIDRNIVRVSESIILRRTDDEAGDRALTTYRVLDRKNRFTLVEAIPHTGRTHQLRVHFAYIGHPIVGDTMYGHASELINRQALHAYELTFTHPEKMCRMTVTAPLPRDMLKLLQEVGFENFME